MKITKQQVKEFLEGIKSEDRVVVFHHNDLDGFAAGILVCDYLKEKEVETLEHFSIKICLQTFERSYSRVEDFDTFIFLDLGDDIVKELAVKLEGKKVLVMDHHPKNTEFPDFVNEFNDRDLYYVPTSKDCYDLVGGRKWLALLGLIADKGDVHEVNQSFIQECLSEFGMSLEDIQKFANRLSEVLVYFNNGGDDAFEHLNNLTSLNDVKSLEKYYRPIENEINSVIEDFDKNKEVYGDVWFYYFEPKFKIKKPLAFEISGKYSDKVIILASPSGDVISFSGRNGVGDLNALNVMKVSVAGLENSGAAGHARGCGGAIQKKDLDKFKKNLKEFTQK